MQDILTKSSSLIREAAYDDESQELNLTFRSNGSKWIYGDADHPFTQADADDLAAASSLGKHFLEYIKDQFPGRRA